MKFLEYFEPSRLVKIPDTPLQFFQLFFTDDRFDTLVEQTNFCFEQVKISSNKNLTFQKTNLSGDKSILGYFCHMRITGIEIFSICHGFLR